MKSHLETRLERLEKVAGERGIKFLPQIVFCDPQTDKPLTTPDPMAKQIWFGVTDKDEQEQILRR